MVNEFGKELDRNGYAESILQQAECCFKCGRTTGKIDRHEVWGGPFRDKSKRLGLWVRLCHKSCHLNGVHQDAEYARRLRHYAQGCAMEEYGWSTEDFIREFGKNYRKGERIMLNIITICGRLTRDPELRYTQSQKPVASFTLAVDRDFGDKETDFVDCVAWNKTAEFVNNYFKKGHMAVASGRLQIRNWTDRDGNKRRSAEIVADRVYFGEAKAKAESAQGQGPENVSASSFEELADDGEIPF